MHPHSLPGRRRFLAGFIQAGLAGLYWLGGARSGLAQGDKRVRESDPLAISLGYRHDASRVDTAAFPKRGGARGSTQYCFNCALYQGDSSQGFAPCSIFQNRLVSGQGWCNAWVAIG